MVVLQEFNIRSTERQNLNSETWLHREDNEHQTVKHLSLIQRLNIAINIVDALDYLHHSHQPPVVQCDRKPINVLLDRDMNAHVGDFGLANLMDILPNN